MATGTIFVNADGTIDHILIGGVRHDFNLSVSPESLEKIDSATERADSAASKAMEDSAQAVSDMKDATDKLSAAVLAAIGFLSVNEDGEICITYEVDGDEIEVDG